MTSDGLDPAEGGIRYPRTDADALAEYTVQFAADLTSVDSISERALTDEEQYLAPGAKVIPTSPYYMRTPADISAEIKAGRAPLPRTYPEVRLCEVQMRVLGSVIRGIFYRQRE